MASPSLRERIVPRRAAANAVISLAESDASSGEDETTFASPTRKRASKTKTRPKPKGKATSGYISSKSEDVTHTRKKQKLSLAEPTTPVPARGTAGEDDMLDSPLTPITASPARQRVQATASPSPPRARLVPRSLRPPAGGNTRHHSDLLSSIMSITNTSVSELTEEEQIGSYIWVRLANSGQPITTLRRYKDVEGMWWPAKLADDSSTLRLYGEPPGEATWDDPSRYLKERFLGIFDIPKYSSDKFANSLSNSGVPASKAKTPNKAQFELKQRWQAAVHLLLDDGKADVELSKMMFSPVDTPSPESHLKRLGRPTSDSPLSDSDSPTPSTSALPAKKRGRGKKPASRRRQSISSLPAPSTISKSSRASSLNEEAFMDPGPDHLLEIPGERVFAKWTANPPYWPARIKEYIPAEAPGQPGLYHLEFCDRQEKRVPRTRFVYEHDKDFTTVKLGQLVSDSLLAAEARGDDMSPDASSLARSYPEEDADMPFPEPTLPPPSPFHEESMHVQVSYILPVLASIVSGTFPTRTSHDDFFAGEREREAVKSQKHLRGEMLEKEKHAMERCLKRWLFGSTREVLRSVDELQDDDDEAVYGTEAKTSVEHDAPSISFGLPGGDDFNRLSRVNRITYYHAVLIPEATFQLLLWQKGERDTTDVQSMEEEERLRTKGQELSQETDWVKAVMQTRQRLIAQARPRDQNKKLAKIQTATRRKPR